MAQSTKPGGSKGCWGCLVVVALVVLILVIRGGDQQQAGLSAGAQGVLRTADGSPVFLAVDQAGLDPLRQAPDARDNALIERMQAAGQVFSVPSGTKCEVAVRVQAGRQVRITEGDRFGDYGWVPIQSVTPQR